MFWSVLMNFGGDETKSQDDRATVEIDLRELVHDIKGARYTILVALILAVVVASICLAVIRPTYSAKAVLGPAERSNSSGLSSALNQLSGASSLLGVNLGSANSGDFVKFTQILQSERLARLLFQDTSLRPIFFGHVWSTRTHSWVEPSGMFFRIKQTLKRLVGMQPWTLPNPFVLQSTLAHRLDTMPDPVTGYLTLNFEAASPAGAQYALAKIIKGADSLVRQDLRSRSAGRISYLQHQLKAITIQDQRQAIIALLSTEERNMMMVSADRIYSADELDPPSASSVPSSPNVGFLVGTLMFLFFLAVSFWACVRGTFSVRKSPIGVKNPDLDSAIWAWVVGHWRSANHQ
jgi:uncharacterized protein involved in exopolysaccharide biosynthesis